MQERKNLYVRSGIIEKAQRGELTADQAEAEAKELGVGPLARTPNPIQYDPMPETFWTTPMAVAWIARRTPKAVRDVWDAYRENCWDWQFREARLGADGPVSEGYFLETRPKASMLILVLSDSCERAVGDAVSEVRPLMSIAAAEEALMVALRTGCFAATGIGSATGVRVTIPAVEWVDLKCFNDRHKDYYSAYGVRAGAPGRYDDVQVRSGDITSLWAAPKPKPGLQLPSLMKPEGAGYMPLFCAALWIAKEGGAVNFDLGETERWHDAYRQLIDRVSSGDVRITGVHNNANESIDGVVFAGCQVEYPYSDRAYELGFSEEYYIQSYPFIDEQHWRGGFDDSLRNHRNVRWKRLMVAKGDVAQFWPFGAEAAPQSGAPGRPTSMHLIVAEFEARIAQGRVEPTLVRQAEVLSAWLFTTHPNSPPAGKKAIENKIRRAYWAAKKT